MNIKNKALDWWAQKNKKGDYVVSGREFPNQRIREALVKDRFACPVLKGYWILKRPDDDVEEVSELLYWQIVSRILAQFRYWSIREKSALAILNGEEMPQKHLLVRTKGKTNRKLFLKTGCSLSLYFDPEFDERLIKKIEIAGRPILIDITERVLIDVGKLKPSSETKNFIAGTQFDTRILEALYARRPKPIIFKHLIDLAKEVKRYDLISDFERIIETHTYYKVAKKEKIKPEFIAAKPAIRPAWVIRQETQTREFEEFHEKQLGLKISQIKRYPLEKLLSQAREHKRYDTYHSTTLEGYRVTPEEVDALLSGLVPKEKKTRGKQYLEDIKNRMAILGYSEAFDFILGKVKDDFKKPLVSEDLVKDTFYHLFKPSADAQIIDYLSLVSYRKIPAFIRGTRYVPPSYEKLADLMTSFVSSVNQIKNPVIKAILAHYFFVTIHPYGDGNGRTARLLMNYLLLTTGYSWITIRADQREEYFAALKKGQLEGNILPFGRFILEMLKEQKTRQQ
jgi:prophage maintenance system killer protein